MEKNILKAEKDSAIRYENTCDEARILQFLEEVKLNNNREWFHGHKERYDEVHAAFEQIVERMIAALSTFDPAVSVVTVKSTLYRF